MHKFKGSHNHALNEVGLYMNTRLSSIVDIYKSFSYAPVKEVLSYPSGHVPGVDSFLDIVVNNYTNNDKFRGSFLTSIYKAYAIKVDGATNTQYGTGVLIFSWHYLQVATKRHFSLFQATSVECH